MKLNNKGFSLAELTVSAGIGVILAGIAGFAFMEAVGLFTRSVRQYQAEADMIGAMYTIKATFSRASSMVYGGEVTAGMEGASATNSWTNVDTVLPAYDRSIGTLFRYPGSSTTGRHLIALFNTEYDVSNSRSDLRAVGVYYRRYGDFNAAEYSSGALYFDIEKPATMNSQTPAHSGSYAKLSPVNSINAFGRFTEFAVENIRTIEDDGTVVMDATAAQIDKPVISAEFKLAMRYFTRGNAKDWRFCPASLIASTAACRTDTNYYDIEKRVKVIFVNNPLSRGNFMSRRPYGNIYFFKTYNPPQ